jgi:subtilase family serine protease
MRLHNYWRGCAIGLGLLGAAAVGAPASAETGAGARVLITRAADDADVIELTGNVRPEATAENDRGRVADDLALEHMLLQLRRSPEQEAALEQYVDGLTEPTAANYHQWLTADEYGSRYGLAGSDISTLTAWLSSHGFTVNAVYPNGVLIDFSGTAGQVRSAFHTEIHQLSVHGVDHIANMSNPKIPAALADAVVGVVSMHDFTPRTLYKPRQDYTFTSSGQTYQAVVPGDLATIYNLNPLFTGGVSGKGQTIVLIEDTNLKNSSDWTTFRSKFGLSSFSSGSFKTVHPAPKSGSNNCSNPGVNGAEGEAALDVEWSSAAAPNATIELASCKDTNTTFGGLLAVQNLINESSTPPAIISISYGECEAFNGATANAAYSSAYQQAATEGVSVFVSSGDEGAASCDADQSKATHGIGVSGFTSTPYNVSVGGTDFGDTVTSTNSTYWSSTNSSTYSSVLSYVPEIPWNDSCAGSLLFSFEGYTAGSGTSGFCNSTTGKEFLTTASGSGGPSGCATGSPSTSGVVSGSCKGTSKPSWQSGVLGIPSDGVRDIPDVSLFAANGLWGHYYVFCFSDTSEGGTSCSGAPSSWAGAGGTSFASPIMAGIQSLVNESTGKRQGNPNPVYYKLAASEYGTSGSTSCNSSNGNTAGSSCVFYDITKGDMDVNCTGKNDCYLPSSTNGVLSTSSSTFVTAYGTNVGWDFATGIGSVNAENLVSKWSSVSP